MYLDISGYVLPPPLFYLFTGDKRWNVSKSDWTLRYHEKSKKQKRIFLTFFTLKWLIIVFNLYLMCLYIYIYVLFIKEKEKKRKDLKRIKERK